MIPHQSISIQLVLKAFLRLADDFSQNLWSCFPLLNSPVILASALIVDDEGIDAVTQALLHHKNSTYSAVVINEGMNLLKSNMEVNDLLQEHNTAFIFLQQLCKRPVNFSGRDPLFMALSSERTRAEFVFPVTIGTVCKQMVQMLDKTHCQW